jgi:hypothetical protein
LLNDEEISTLLSEKDSKSKKRATKLFKSIFEEYLHENPTNAVELAAILTLFYAEARKQNGKLYWNSSLSALRFGLNRHFKELCCRLIVKMLLHGTNVSLFLH